MKYMATFVLCLFRALYQGTDKILDFPKNLYNEKTKAVSIVAGYIDKVPTLVEGREGLIKKIRLYLWKPISHNRWTVGLMSKRTYGNL